MLIDEVEGVLQVEGGLLLFAEMERDFGWLTKWREDVC